MKHNLKPALYIEMHFPDIRGFTRSNIFRTRQLYETYHNDEKVSPVVRQLPWIHNLLIMSRCKRAEEREFFTLNEAKGEMQ